MAKSMRMPTRMIFGMRICPRFISGVYYKGYKKLFYDPIKKIHAVFLADIDVF